MQKLSIILLLSFISTFTFAQKHYTKTGTIIFNASSPLEKIEAKNKAAAAIVNTETGEVKMSALVKSFVFPNKLMQKHFNENYLHTSKYPKASYSGTISNLSEVNFDKDGVYKALVKGKLTMHGVTQSQDVRVTFTIKSGAISFKTGMVVTTADYKVVIPLLVRSKIAKTVNIGVAGNLKEL